MIQINLLPGAQRTRRSAGPSLNVGAMFSGALAQVKDPFLIVAVAGLVIGLGALAFLYVTLGRQTTALEERRAQAVKDSTLYAIQLADRRAAEAQQDSVDRQFKFIRAVDGERYSWPHVLDELSRALPAYTWLTKVQQTSTVISAVLPVDSAAAPPPQADTTKAKRARRARTGEERERAVQSSVPQLKLRVTGQTVDIQAMTHYIRVLEASPFLENVTFVGSDIKAADGREVIEFIIDMSFQTPAPSAIRTVPLTVAVR
jgi:Tfp pilus assembly protein PilN